VLIAAAIAKFRVFTDAGWALELTHPVPSEFAKAEVLLTRHGLLSNSGNLANVRRDPPRRLSRLNVTTIWIALAICCLALIVAAAFWG
jgi:hypothetical protein